MSSSQPGSLTSPPSTSSEERIRERAGGREKRDGGQRWRQEETPGKTQSFFFFFSFYSPSFSAWLPSCYNVKLVFLSVYREPRGPAAWRQRRRGKWFGREAEEERDEEGKEQNGIRSENRGTNPMFDTKPRLMRIHENPPRRRLT